MAAGVGDGEVIGAVREIGLAPFGQPDRRQGLTGLLQIELPQEGPTGLMAAAPSREQQAYLIGRR